MVNKWSERGLEYLKSIKGLGRLLCTNNCITDPTIKTNFIQFGDNLVTQTNDAKQNKQGNAELSTNPNLVFNIPDNIDIHPDPGLAQITIGGIAEFKHGILLRQSVTLLILFTPTKVGNVFSDNKTYVVRKIHFDFDRDNTQHVRPTTHTQIGGNISEKMLPETISYEQIEPEIFNQIDIPRIPSPPYGLASVIDLALREFGNPRLQELTQEPGWKKQVSEEEYLLLSSYHERLKKEFESTSHRTNYDFHCSEALCDIKHS